MTLTVTLCKRRGPLTIEEHEVREDDVYLGRLGRLGDLTFESWRIEAVPVGMRVPEREAFASSDEAAHWLQHHLATHPALQVGEDGLQAREREVLQLAEEHGLGSASFIRAVNAHMGPGASRYRICQWVREILARPEGRRAYPGLALNVAIDTAVRRHARTFQSAYTVEV